MAVLEPLTLLCVEPSIGCRAAALLTAGGAATPLPDMDRAVLLSDGEAAALSIEEAAEESESFMHGNLSHVTALGQVHHIQDHAPQSAAFVRQKALAVAAITGVLLDPHRR